MKMRTLLLFSFIATIIGCTSAQLKLSPVVKTKTGQVKGQLIQVNAAAGQDVYQFTGIPYAEPPVGERRFRKPVPKTPWVNVLEATKVPNSCYPVLSPADPTSLATIMDKEMAVPGSQQSEDCLYLNIWAPSSVVDAVAAKGSTPKPLAVYFYIHGGGFTSETSMRQWYNATMLSGYDNIIVVTTNYRLGSLGFAYFGKNDEAPGNAGLWDMVEALKWVSENIAAFGGNPNAVTLGGQSSGGVSVTLHLLSQHSRKYFQKAIAQSGAATFSYGARTPEVATAATDALIKQTCGKTMPANNAAEKLKCLRSLDAVTIATADAQIAGVGVVVDGDFLPKMPSEMLASGDFYKVPLLMGTTRDETSMLLFQIPMALQLLPSAFNPAGSYDKLTYTHYSEIMKSVAAMATGGSTDPVIYKALLLHYWPTSPQPQGGSYPKGVAISNVLTTPVTDSGATCPVLSWINAAASSQKQPIYAYQFSQPVPDGSKRCAAAGAMCKWYDQFPSWLGATHGIDLPYIFGWPFMPNAQGWNYVADDKLLSQMVMEYWGNFIKNGDPNVRDPPVASHSVPTSFLNDRGRLPTRRPVISRRKRDTYSLPRWPTYGGDEQCQRQAVDLSVSSLIVKKGAPICGLKVRDCMFWTELFPQLMKSASKP